MNVRTLIGTGVLAFVLAPSAGAVELFVPSQYPTIQDAIEEASFGDTVMVADGVYTGPGNRDISFRGKAITVRSENGPTNCIIDCQGTQQNPHRGFDFDGETAAAILDGFTITNGSTLQGAILDEFNGGGILVRNGNPTIKNCIIAGNWAGCWGAGICLSWFGDSSPTIINCTISDNVCGDDGGAIFSFDNSPTIINSLIVNNEARIGGGINHFGTGSVTVINSTIAGNIASHGAGIYGTNLSVNNSIIWGNVGGQQIYGTPTVEYSDVEGGFPGTGNLDVDPGFADAANGDFHLMASSTLVDAGDPDFVPAPSQTDLDGEPRLIGDLVDMGVDELRRPADLNADGVVGVGDLLALFADWGACPGCLADLNHDDRVGVADLLILMADWG